MSRMLDRSALRMKSLNCFRDEIFLATDESLFHSLSLYYTLLIFLGQICPSEERCNEVNPM